MERFLKSRYRIGDKISENPFCVSYKGFFLGTDKPLIIKIYKRGTLNSSLINVMKRKVKEFSLIKHHNIAQLIDGDYGWQGFYYVREFVRGKSLRELLLEHKDIGADKAVAIAEEVARAVEAVHARGVIHGSLKPGNIFIDLQGVVKVTDFVVDGEIKEALPQKALTLMEDGHYTSPEELKGKTASASSDIYALGMILGEMFLPEGLRRDKGLRGSLKKLRASSLLTKDEVVDLPRYLQDILLKALQVKPRLRFATMAEFRESLEKKNLVIKTPVNEEYVTIFENTVNRFGEDKDQEKEKEEGKGNGEGRGGIKKEVVRNIVIASILLLSFISGLLYVFLFGR
ncbi:MAG: serine/threonine-protein kinase [Candidatus Margulisiibacteriota bacterium]|nr:serine/threonine-protein kinase [Candidatus Margulisiibacteriota bacterium]